MFEAGNTDHEEFVEVRAENGEELDAFEERVCGVVGFFEDAALEAEEAEFAVDEEAAVIERESGLRWGGSRLGLAFLLSHAQLPE